MERRYKINFEIFKMFHVIFFSTQKSPLVMMLEERCRMKIFQFSLQTTAFFNSFDFISQIRAYIKKLFQFPRQNFLEKETFRQRNFDYMYVEKYQIKIKNEKIKKNKKNSIRNEMRPSQKFWHEMRINFHFVVVLIRLTNLITFIPFTLQTAHLP